MSGRHFAPDTQMWLPDIGPSTGSGQGMYYYRARIYAPSLGRFLQTDPIGYGEHAAMPGASLARAAGMNLYAYVGNDPVNYVDPLGLSGDIVVTGWSSRSYCNKMRERGGWSDILDYECGGSAFYDHFGFEDDSSYDDGGSGDGGGDIIVAGPSDEHHYTISGFSTCNPDELFSTIRRQGNSAPNAPYARTGVTRNVRLADSPFDGSANYITQVVDPTTRSITNITQPGHRYYPGTVNIQVSEGPVGTS